MLGQPNYITAGLGEQCFSKLKLEHLIIENKREPQYFYSEILEHVSYFENVTFSSKPVQMRPITNEKVICIDKFLSGLMSDEKRSFDVAMSNQLMPIDVLKRIFRKLHEIGCETLFFVRDSRIENELGTENEALKNLLEKAGFLPSKKLNVGKREVSEYRSSLSVELKKFEIKLSDLETEISQRETEDFEIKAINDELTKSVSLLENENSDLLHEKEKLESEIIALRKSLETLANENHHILIRLSKE